MKNKKPTITIGIPAHNEADNVLYLLQSIMDQRQKNYMLEKIFVLCDDCTDSTAAKVRMFAKKYPLIRAIDDGMRKGKAGRLNQLYQKNRSDLVFNIDADVILSGKEVIEKMVKHLGIKDVVLVSGNNQPAESKTLVERIYNAGYRMWYEIRKDYEGGHNVWNIHGMAVGLRNSFAKSFQYPESAYISDGGFAFVTAKRHKKEFRFVKDAIIVFRSVNNFRDFFLQASRNLYQKKSIADYCGSWIYDEYYIPRKFKVKGILKSLILDPIFTSASLIFSIILRIFPLAESSWRDTVGSYKSSLSTKKVIFV